MTPRIHRNRATDRLTGNLEAIDEHVPAADATSGVRGVKGEGLGSASHPWREQGSAGRGCARLPRIDDVEIEIPVLLLTLPIQHVGVAPVGVH